MSGALRIAQPAIEPVTLAEVKAQLRITHSAEDALIERRIRVAREAAEERLERTLITTTWRVTLDAFPTAIRLPNPRIQSVDSIQFLDVNGALQTLDPADYIVDTVKEPGWIVPGDDKAWPDTRERINAVIVEYKAGYGDTADTVPAPIAEWIILAVGDLMGQRTLSSDRPTVPTQFHNSLLDLYRVYG
jgi:uncharacterized phiE125 gp8 family phage protein